MIRVHLLLACIVLTGCLGPQVSDATGPHPDILPPGSVVPAGEDDVRVRSQLEENDGVAGVIVRVNGFAAGAPTRGWDFGPAPSFAAPLFVLVARDAGGDLAPIAHNTIVESIPGDATYSPYWAVFFVEVTDEYSGELITSSAAVSAAVSAGLVKSPIARPLAVNCPAVAADVRLDVGPGLPALPPPSRFYFNGTTIPYFDFGPMPLDNDRVTVPEARKYVLRREGGEPLSEPVRNIDLVGDGDLVDTNDIFERAADDPERSPLCRTVSVAVASSVSSIDTSGNDSVADLQRASDLFAPDPVPGLVIAYESSQELRNCPAQRSEGGL